MSTPEAVGLTRKDEKEKKYGQRKKKKKGPWRGTGKKKGS